jgi:hypothetical protein
MEGKMLGRSVGIRQTLMLLLVIGLGVILLGQEALSLDEARAVFVVA